MLAMLRGHAAMDHSRDSMRKVTPTEFFKDSTTIVRDAAAEPIMICDPDGTPIMIISTPVIDDEVLGDPRDR